MKTLSAPLSICLAITNKCNLSCKHCLAASSQKNQDLTTEELFSIIRQIKELKIFDVSIFGGEPLLREDFFELLEAFSVSKIVVGLNTNGTLITKDTARRLSGSSIRGYTVSLDGSKESVQDPFRGEGSFKKNIEGIRNLADIGANITISTIITKYNFSDIENIILLCKNIGVRNVRFNSVMYTGNASCYWKEIRLTPKEKLIVADKIKGLKKEHGNFISGSWVQTAEILEEIKDKPLESFPLVIYPCSAGTTKCAIRPDGWVVPCEILWEVKAGNLREESFYEIWHNSSTLKAFREPIEIQDSDIPECKSCRYLRLCYKGHRCQPYYYPGSRFEHKELYCWREDKV